MSANWPPALRISTTSRLTELSATRAVFRRLRKMSWVPVELAATMARLIASCTGASAVAMKRVPMLMPSAPSASAAASPRPSAKPPEAIIGMVTWSAAAGIKIRPGTSSSPGCPAHSKPSMLIASTPMAWALRACRTLVHLCITRTPRACSSASRGSGFDPAVSTMSTPESMAASRYSSYGGGLIVGKMVRFTPNGWSVISRHRAISRARASGLGWVSAVMKPRAPALATAATSSARPTHCMPPCVMGCSTPNISVNGVEIMACPPRTVLARRPEQLASRGIAVEQPVGPPPDPPGAVGTLQLPAVGADPLQPPGRAVPEVDARVIHRHGGIPVDGDLRQAQHVSAPGLQVTQVRLTVDEPLDRRPARVGVHAAGVVDAIL